MPVFAEFFLFFFILFFTSGDDGITFHNKVRRQTVKRVP